MKEKVICYGSAIRPQYWMSFYDSLAGKNDIDFEILFTGQS